MFTSFSIQIVQVLHLRMPPQSTPSQWVPSVFCALYFFSFVLSFSSMQQSPPVCIPKLGRWSHPAEHHFCHPGSSFQVSSASSRPAAKELYTGCSCPISLKLLQPEANVFQIVLYYFNNNHIWLLAQPCWIGGEGATAGVLWQHQEHSREKMIPKPANKQSLVAGQVLVALR